MSLKNARKTHQKVLRKKTKREDDLELMRQNGEEDFVDIIRANLAHHKHKCTRFLRVRQPNGGSRL